MTGQHRLWQDGASRNAIEYLKVGNLTGESKSVFDGNRFVTFGPRALLFQNSLQHGQEKHIVSVQIIQGIAFSKERHIYSANIGTTSIKHSFTDTLYDIRAGDQVRNGQGNATMPKDAQ
jgi:hypothetical protein